MLKSNVFRTKLRQSRVFKPKRREISFDVQQTLPFSSPQVNRILRDFYEVLAKAIFEGKSMDRNNETNDIEPDLTDIERRRYIEVKCAGHTRRIMLKDEQIAKYARLQLSDFPIENPRIYFSMFRYAVRGIEEHVKDYREDQVINFLTANTSYLVGLPFSVIYHIHQHGLGLSKSGLYSRCETERSNPVTNFSTRAFELFFAEPEQALADISLNSDDFTIRRTKTSKRISVNSYPLIQFPITLVKDNNDYHQKFIKRLREERDSKVPF